MYRLLVKSGKDPILFIGELINKDGDVEPFTSYHGTILKGIVYSSGYNPSFIELSKLDQEDILTDDESNFIHDFIQTNKITKVITLGRNITTSLFPSITKGQTMSNLVISPLITPLENQDIKVGVAYSTLNVYLNKDENSIMEFSGRILDLLSNKKPKYNVDVSNIENEETFMNLLDYLDSTSDIISLDYETNGVDAFREDFYITMISLAILVDANNSKSWWYWPKEKRLSDACRIRYLKFLKENKHRIFAFNVGFELKVSWHELGEKIELQDTRVLAIVQAQRDSLKDLIRKHFGATFWESSINSYKSEVKELFSIVSKHPDLVKACLEGNLKFLLESDKTQTRINSLLESYSTEEVSESLTHYPFEWAAIPKLPLGIYCAYDSGYTVLLTNKLLDPKYKFAYDYYIKHQYLSAVFETNGVSWNDNEATKLTDEYIGLEIDLLNKVIQECDLPAELKLEAKAICAKELPYQIIKYTPKQRKEKIIPVTTYEDKLSHLKEIFNPGSNTKASRDIFWNSYLNDKIQLGGLLILFLENIELTGMLPDLYNELGDKSFIYQNDPQVVMNRIVELGESRRPISKQINNSLSIAVEEISEYENKFAAPAIKFQYKVHSTFFGLKIEDESTWSREFKMLFNIFYFKKINKMLSTSVNGNTGRQEVFEIKGYLHGKPLRGTNYFDLKDKNVPLILNTDFHSLAAITNRWSSGFHCLKGNTLIKLTDNNSISIEEIFNRKNQKELEVFSVKEGTTNIIKSNISEVLLSGYANEMIELTLENGKIIECTPNHRFLMTNGEYIEAKDITNETELFEFE